MNIALPLTLQLVHGQPTCLRAFVAAIDQRVAFGTAVQATFPETTVVLGNNIDNRIDITPSQKRNSVYFALLV